MTLSNVFAGIVHHAHMNGSEVAVKSPKTKVALNPRDLKKFEKEISLQAKVSDTIHFLSTMLSSGTPRLIVPLCRCATPTACRSWRPALTPPTPSSSWSGYRVATGLTSWPVIRLPPRTSASGRCARCRRRCSTSPRPQLRHGFPAVNSASNRYLHDPLIGIVHGDVKSLNVLIMRDGSSKVLNALICWTICLFLHNFLTQFCDFGGAVQVLSTNSSVSSVGSLAKVATRAFSAPELFKGELKSPATDMYAFGIMLWEFATCDVPFADNPDLISDQVKAGIRPRIPSPTPEGFPPDYFKLMQECWSDDPWLRPTAEQAHRRLLSIDPSVRPVQGPIVLWHPSRARAPASLLRCILAAMQAEPGQINAQLALMLEAMVQDAARIVSGCPKVQQLMQQHRLTEMEAETVSLYTTDARDHGGLREHSIFFVYNTATRSGNPRDVELWSLFSFLFCSALEKLPSVACTVFRGLDVPLTQLSHQYSSNGTVWFPSVTSTTTDKAGTLLQFGTGASGRPGTLLQINAVDAKDVSEFSKFKAENEYIIPPNSCHKVQVALSSTQVKKFKLK